jgi:hypothetical protein
MMKSRGGRLCPRGRDAKAERCHIVLVEASGEQTRLTAWRSRLVRTIRTECLDWLLMLNQQYLDGALEPFVLAA